MLDGLVELLRRVLRAEDHDAHGRGLQHGLEVDADGLDAEARVLEALGGQEVAVLVLQRVLGGRQALAEGAEGGAGIERGLVDDFVAVGQLGVQAQGHAAVAADGVAAVDADLLDDGQGGVERAARGDHDLVAGGHHGLRGFADGGGHVAVVVHQGAVHVQGDHELLSCDFGFSLVFDASG